VRLFNYRKKLVSEHPDQKSGESWFEPLTP
jgi:hypothetical protein